MPNEVLNEIILNKNDIHVKFDVSIINYNIMFAYVIHMYIIHNIMYYSLDNRK